MTWNTDLVTMLRVLTNDLSTPQKRSDTFLRQSIIAAGLISSQEVEYLNVYVFNFDTLSITPDPVISGDSAFQALVPLKAACILNQGDFQTGLGQAIKVRDGDSAIDTSVGFRGFRDIIQLGPCAVYEQLRWRLTASNGAKVVGAVFSPKRSPVDSPVGQLESFFNHIASILHGHF